MQVKVKKEHPDACLPRKATPGSACFDLCALFDGVDEVFVDIAAGGRHTIRTGLAFEVPEGYVMKIYSRSGHGFKHGVRLSNGTGIIDSDYRGEVKVQLKNDGQEPFTVRHGDRIAQAMIVPVPVVELIEVDELSETERGTGGFGSTGS